MKFLTGLFDRAVLQRNSTIVCTGEALPQGAVWMRAAPKRPWLRCGQSARGRFQATLKSLKAGGPFTFEFQVRSKAGAVLDALSVSDVLVGDVWILGGQSNMEGVGLMRYAGRPDPYIRCFYKQQIWNRAVDPLHSQNNTGPGSIPSGKLPHAGVGPGLFFGREMQTRTGVPQGLIPCALGGSSMSQWNPEEAEKPENLYGQMMRRVKACGGRVAGMIWYQGCSDTGPESVKLYTQRMKALMARVRRDLNMPRLPIVLAQLSRTTNGVGDPSGGWNSIREQQRLLPGPIKHLAVVATIDLRLDDSIHVSGRDMPVVGRRMAEQMDVLMRGRQGGLPTPSLLSVEQEASRPGLQTALRVKFAHVQGKLKAGGRPMGFAVSRRGVPSDLVYDVELDGSDVLVKLGGGPEVVMMSDLLLYYGFDTNPHCTIVDEGGRSIPAFGPVPVSGVSPMTPMADKVKKSPLYDAPESIRKVEFPKVGKIPWSEAEFLSGFVASARKDIVAAGNAEKVVYFRAVYQCDEPARVKIQLGYDGPLKVFNDGKAVFCDPYGTNPIVVDERSVVVNWSKGRHELVLALMTNQGAAWGICLRLELVGRRSKTNDGAVYEIPLRLIP